MNGNDSRTVAQLLKLADRPAGPPASDHHLLGQVAAEAGGPAFDELVRRHGPMVLGVCRRVLGHEQDAEDAFQAVFLVLVRKAAAVRNGRSVGSWLFGVARHVAVRLREKDRRRRRHEFRAVAGAPPVGQDGRGGSEVLAVLDEEVRRLPERYREPIVVCHLQGLTQEEAAGELGRSVRTLRRQLDRGRELLKARLANRGVTAPAALLATCELTAVVPAALADTTRRAAVAFVSGRELAAPVAALAKGALAMSTVAKLKLLTGAVFALGGVVALWPVAAAALPGPADPPAPPAPATTPQPPPADRGGAQPKGGAPGEDTKAAGTDYRIRPGEYLHVRATNVFETEPINGVYAVEAGGTVVLGPAYGGRVRVGGLTVEEAERAVQTQIRMFAKYGEVALRRYDPVIDGPNPALDRRGRPRPKDGGRGADGRVRPGEHLYIRAGNVFEFDPINGVYAVEPSGKVLLGPTYGGRVRVGGLTVEEAERAVRAQIGMYAKNVQVALRRYDPVTDCPRWPLERRVLELEQEVDDLRAIVDELRKKRP